MSTRQGGGVDATVAELQRLIDRLRDALSHSGLSTSHLAEGDPAAAQGTPREAELRGAQTRAVSRSTAAPLRRGIFRQQDEYWIIECDGVVCHLKDTKGLRHLAWLLHHAGQDFAACELRIAADGVEPSVCGRTRIQDREYTQRSHLQDSAGPLVDHRTKVEYRQRIRELQREEDDAERCGDCNQVTRARVEREEIEEWLLKVTRPGGKSRLGPSADDNARSAVTKAIRAAIKRIRHANRALGEHLQVHIQTGWRCLYVPDLAHPILWSD